MTDSKEMPEVTSTEAEQTDASADSMDSKKGLARLDALFSYVSIPKELEQAGIKIFTVVSVVMCLFLLLNLFANSNDYLVFNSLDYFLKIMSAALVVALVAKSKNVISLILGMFLIGALIVPAKEIVGFYMTITGESTAREAGDSLESNGVDLHGRVSDVSSKIVDELQQAGFITVDGWARKDSKRIIESNLIEERVITVLEQVRASAALETLVLIQRSVKETLYEFRGQEKLLQDFYYLRSKGLIRFAYDDFADARLTDFGREVLLRLDRSDSQWSEASANEFSDVNALSQWSEPLFTCPEYPEIIEVLQQKSVRLDGTDPIVFFRLEMLEEQAVTISVNATQGDPVLYVYDSSCSEVGYNDDFDGTLNSRIEQTLARDSYIIAVRNFDDEIPVQATVIVE